MIKSCLKTLGILIGILCAPLVLWVVYFALALNPKIDEEVSRYNGLCITATERYDLYIERLTGLQGKSNAHDITPLAAIIGPIENEGRVSYKGYDSRFCFNEKERKEFFIIT